MKKNPRKMEVFHAFIGVMAFIAYALPFMFVTKSLSYRFQALSDRADFQLEQWGYKNLNGPYPATNRSASQPTLDLMRNLICG